VLAKNAVRSLTPGFSSVRRFNRVEPHRQRRTQRRHPDLERWFCKAHGVVLADRPERCGG
jgi:hypothetical protein